MYAKLASNPLWNDILAGLLVFTNANKLSLSRAWPDLRPGSKFSLYSAHDTTIMALLASLGGDLYESSNTGLWPPYASMLNIELFDIEWNTDDANEVKEHEHDTIR